MVPETVLLSTACCAPLCYFSRFLSNGKVYLEQHENFIKQTFRNRYSILGPNGPLNLVIPVEKGRKPGLKIRDVRIAYYEEWQRNHWRTIVTSYRNSPWFSHYEEEIKLFYSVKTKYLFDYNLAYLETLLLLLDIRKEILLTEGFEMIPGRFENYREKISPKNEPSEWISGYLHPVYTQVFNDKFPFVPGLSILDLLFNEGAHAKGCLAGVK